MRKTTVAAVALALLPTAFGQNQCINTVNPTTGYMNVTTNASLAPANITIEAWVFFNAMNLAPAGVYPTIIRKNVLAGQEVYFLRVSQGNGRLAWKVRLPGGASVTATAPAAFPTGVWTHVAGTWNGTTSRLYINGVQVATATGNGALTDNGGDVRVGEGDAITGGGEEWNGSIDELRIWSTERTATQILGGMTWEMDGQPNLVSCWHLNGNFADTTGGNHGAQVGSVSFGPSAVPLSTGAPPFQTNSPVASMDVDGVQGDGFSAAIVNKTYTACTAAAATVSTSSTNVGFPWDMAVTAGPSVSAINGGFYTAAGQAVNINLSDPTVSFLNGLTLTTPFVPLTIPLSIPANFDVTAQMFVVAPSSLDGIVLSGVNELHVAAGATTIAGPTGDDTAVTVQLSNPALCGAPTTIPFYGVNYTQFDVISNGRVMFGAPTPNTSFTPSAAAALTSYAFAGAWCDLNPATSGNITISTPTPGIVRVSYNAVPYFGTTNPVTFAVQFDGILGTVSIDGLNTIPTGTGQQFLGMSPGVLGPATDPGQAAFALGGPFAPPNATDMIYRVGTQGTLATGLVRLDFVPVGNNYVWYGL